MKAAEMLVEQLHQYGVDVIFGLCGHTNIAVLAALEHSPIQFVTARHEQVAAHAADGFARATGKPGVVLLHVGPGLTNATTGVATAALDSIPLVVIAGDVPSYYFGHNPHQEVNLHLDGDQFEIYRPFVKRAWRVASADELPDTVYQAYRLATSGRPGPVLIDVPMDLFSREVADSVHIPALPIAPSNPTISDQQAREIATWLNEAERPLIHVGGGVILSRASRALEEFVDLMGIPVSHTLMGKGAFDDGHPLNLGMTGFWARPSTNEYTRSADRILAIGTRFAEADSSSWDPRFTFAIPPSELIHIDLDPVELGRNFPVKAAYIADAAAALDQLVLAAKSLTGRTRADLQKHFAMKTDEFHARVKPAQTSSDCPMRPERILADIRNVCPASTLFITDVGWNKNGIGQQFPITVPGTFLTPGGLATMGFGPAAAIGTAFGRPDVASVAIIGDGAMGSQLSVIATAVEQDLPIVWVVMNNSAFGTIAGLEHQHYQTTYGTEFLKNGEPYSPDFAAIARAFGAEGVRITRADEFATVLSLAISSKRPTVIEVPTQNVPVPTAGHWDINDIYESDFQRRAYRPE